MHPALLAGAAALAVCACVDLASFPDVPPDATADATTTDAETTIADTRVEAIDSTDSADDSAAADSAATDSAATDSADSADSAADTPLGDDTAVDDTAGDDGDASTATVSDQIRAVIAAPDGPATLAVDGATVTYIKPAVGFEPAGFFVQAERAGPALFVGVDATAPEPDLTVGARVAFVATQLRTIESRREVSGVTGLERLGAGLDPEALVQEVSLAADLTLAPDDYAAELVRLEATLVGAWRERGAGHAAIDLDSAGLVGDARLGLRAPSAIADALDVVAGCAVQVTGPLWRSGDRAEPSAYALADVVVRACPPPRLLAAEAESATRVRLRFDRRLAGASVAPAGFAIHRAGGGAALAIGEATAEGREVVLTTAPQTPGAAYEVSALASVTDASGQAVAADADTAGFVGFGARAVLRIDEVNPVIAPVVGIHCDLIELVALSGGSLDGVSVRVDSQLVVTFGAPRLANVAAGERIVLHLNPSGIACRGVDAQGAPLGGAINETGAVDEVVSTTYYPTAWDVWAVHTGLSSQSLVLFVLDADGVMVDAVALHRVGTSVLSSSVDAAERARQAGAWTDPGAPYDEPRFVAHAVPGIDLANSLPASPSFGRVGAVDTDSAADWVLGPPTFGAAPQ